MPINKRWLIGGAVVVVLAILFLRGGEEPPQKAVETAQPTPAPMAPLAPTRPPAPQRDDRARDWYYGYYDQPGYAPPPSRPWDERGAPWSGEAFREAPYAGPAWQSPREPERYRFRPLDERERARMEAAAPIPDYGLPYYSTPERRREERSREPYRWDTYPAEPYPQQTYPGWQREGYGYRGPERAAGGARSQPGPGWDLGRDYGNAWTLPPDAPSLRQAPAWDLPPGGRMYPSLPTNSDRRFTVR